MSYHVGQDTTHKWDTINGCYIALSHIFSPNNIIMENGVYYIVSIQFQHMTVVI